jgi:3-dehydroquinate dehydratase type I
MRRYRNVKNQGKICLSIVEPSLPRAREAISKANGLADLMELRVDFLRHPHFAPLLEVREKPLIVTNRRRDEGGRYQGSEGSRLAVLREAVDLGVEFVDVELRSGRSALEKFIAHPKKSRLILSAHDFEKTPSPKALRRLFQRMERYEAEVIKIVTLARSIEDNLRVLSLIPYAKAKKRGIIAFCMGEKGKMSRVFAPLMGAAWTYASLDRKRVSAPGQLTALEIREVWERLK